MPRRGAKEVVIQTLIAIACLICSACSGRGMGGGAASADEGDEHRLVGVQAPSFELNAQNGGETVSLEAARGKVVIVDFWATWCKPCKESFPFYQRLVGQHGGELMVIGVSVDEEPDGIADFARETGATFPLVWDEGQALSRESPPPTMPTSYIIDRSGIVRFVHAGFKSGTEEDLQSKVASLL